MKFFLTSVIVLLSMIVGSCEKTHPATNGQDAAIERKIRFQLCTDEDFSGETSTIQFSIFIRDARITLFDSSLAPMQLKDIPDAAHKIIVEKTVSANGSSNLAAGFHYEIQNVGHSGYTDTSKAGNELKVIDYIFH